MALETVELIKKAELKAEKLIADAKLDAEKAVKEAEVKAIQIKADAKKNAADYEETSKSAILKAAAEVNDKAAADALIECARVSAKADENRSGAVEKCIGQILD